MLMKVFVIGGTKFMGPHVVRMLQERGHEVVVFHRGQTKTELSAGIREILGDRNDLETFKSEMESFKPDVVLDMISIFERHAHELVNVCKGVADRAAVVSSADVYRAYEVLTKLTEDEPQSVPIKETDEVRTVLYPYRGKMEGDFANDYDKIPIEKVILHNPDLLGTILRLPMVYGPNDPNRRFAQYIQRMKDNRSHILLDERIAEWKSTKGYSENVAAGIVAAVENQASVKQIYNVGEEITMSELQWIMALKRLMNWNGEVVVVPKEAFGEELPLETRQDLVMDTSKIRTDLKFNEHISLDEGLRKTIQWELETLEQNPLQIDYAREDAIIQKL